MAQYFVETPHTKDECLKALDETLKKGPDFLAKFEWGCMAGDHTGYGVVDADNEMAARNQVPSVVRDRAQIHPVTRVTPDDIRSMHQH